MGEKGAAAAEDTESLQALSALLFQRENIRLSDYKDRWLSRRISARFRSTRTSDLISYVEYIRDHPQELDRLLDALAINISSFFRNRETFDSIEQNVFESWKKLPGRRIFQAWSCACAEGQEPYSLAMLWRQHLSKCLNILQLKILATDIDADALAKAKTAEYTAAQIETIPDDYAQFVEHNRVSEAIRKSVRFDRQNALTFKPAIKFDLILCRNLLIFLDSIQQKQFLKSIHSALANRGYVVFGKVESLFLPQQCGFHPIDLENRIYQKV